MSFLCCTVVSISCYGKTTLWRKWIKTTVQYCVCLVYYYQCHCLSSDNYLVICCCCCWCKKKKKRKPTLPAKNFGHTFTFLIQWFLLYIYKLETSKLWRKTELQSYVVECVLSLRFFEAATLCFTLDLLSSASWGCHLLASLCCNY